MAHRRVLANQHVALNLMCSETGIQRKIARATLTPVILLAPSSDQVSAIT